MSCGGFGATASGDINPRRFVKDGSTAGFVTEAGAGEGPIRGISQPGVRRATTPDVTHTLAAKVNEGLRVFGLGEVCELEIGATVSGPGVRLKAASGGKGTPVTANNDQYGAVSLAGGASGDFIPVRVEIGVQGA